MNSRMQGKGGPDVREVRSPQAKKGGHRGFTRKTLKRGAGGISPKRGQVAGYQTKPHRGAKPEVVGGNNKKAVVLGGQLEGECLGRTTIHQEPPSSMITTPQCSKGWEKSRKDQGSRLGKVRNPAEEGE